MKIEFKEEMRFSEIESDFIPQLKNYLKRSKDICIDVDVNVYQIIRMPRIILNFMIDGLGKDKDNNANFINYVKASYCFMYSSNTDIIKFVVMRGSERQQLFDFKKMNKGKKTCDTEKIFRQTDLAQLLIEEKTDIRIRYTIAFKFALMIGDFINAYMKSRGIKILKIEELDENGRPIIVDKVEDNDTTIPDNGDTSIPEEDNNDHSCDNDIIEESEYIKPIIGAQIPRNSEEPHDDINESPEVPEQKPEEDTEKEPVKYYEFIYQRHVYNSDFE